MSQSLTNITATLRLLATKRQPALIPYLTSGYPHPNLTLPLLCALSDAGADIIEVGVPYSDPTADGPVIQQSCHLALTHGVNLAQTLDTIAAFRQIRTTPIILFGYVNPVLQMGYAACAQRCKAAGVDGLLIVDLPLEEAGPLRDNVVHWGMDWIALWTQTSRLQRIPLLREVATGFVYYVSMKGVTGSATAPDHETIAANVTMLRKQAGLPVGVGFGIRTTEDAAIVGSYADAVVVGSELIRRLGTPGDSVDQAFRYVQALRQALPSGE
ncbi:MAG: tryptophan synthase subunit alpha [Myxococcales bacterium]|nr:tryptophan synthase subunit alpha [Myxococcales bacterium]